jgi:glucoamylase
LTRPVILGNGVLTLLADQKYTFRELYYPVSMDNHLHAFRTGIWSGGNFAWCHDLDVEVGYDQSLTSVCLINSFGASISFKDTVDFAYPVLLRRVDVTTKKAVRLFFALDFHISGHDEGDTALYDPFTRSIIHYKEDRWFLLSSDLPFFQFATGYKESRGLQGTWKDCEDGELSGNRIAQGAVDSAVSFEIENESTFHIWLAAGEDYAKVKKLNDYVRTKLPSVLRQRSDNYWKAWLSVADTEDYAPFEEQLRRSLLILAAHVQKNGALPASLDTDIMRFNRDTYNYVWGRDAAYCALALSTMGYIDMSRSIFSFLLPLIMYEGCLFQKYTTDGRWGSTWHPWEGDYIPIQEDETAILIYALWQHFKRFRDVDFVKPYFRPGIVAAGDFMLKYTDGGSGIPLPSYDLWEERKGVHLYTLASVIAGLRAAASFATFFGESELASRYLNGAGRTLQIVNSMWLGDHFARSATLEDGKLKDIDPTVDSSSLLLSILGVYPATDPRILANRTLVAEKLGVAGGLARYENDPYMRGGETPNPWFITTLWLSEQYALEGNLEASKKKVEWVLSNSLRTGAIPEQMTKDGGYPSVTPLAWSHAELVRAVFALKMGRLEW